MSDLRELYQELIVDHGRHPRNFGKLAQANHCKEGFNPLCGDKITVFLLEKDNKIEEIMFEGSGCAISMASASLMSENIKGKSREQVEKIFSAFHEMVMQGSLSEESKNCLGKLVVLLGVTEFPMRVKCATLAWHTLIAALNNDLAVVTTENESSISR